MNYLPEGWIFRVSKSYNLHIRICCIQFCTRVKLALICSWDSDWRMLRHSWAEVASDSSSWQPGSLRVWLILIRTRFRLKLSFLVPSWRTTKPTLTFSRASLVSRMAELKETTDWEWIGLLLGGENQDVKEKCLSKQRTILTLFSLQKSEK